MGWVASDLARRCPDWRPGRCDASERRFESARLPNPDPAMKIRIGCGGCDDRRRNLRLRAGSGMATMKWLARQE